MSATRSAWVVAASIGAVEALKDQLGFCRWNYPLRSLQQHDKANLVRSYNYQSDQRLVSAGSSRSSSYSSSSEKVQRREEKLKKVMELNCWGPSTVRFF